MSTVITRSSAATTAAVSAKSVKNCPRGIRLLRARSASASPGRSFGLQADDGRVMIEQRLQHPQRNRTVVVVRMTCIAGPDDTNLWCASLRGALAMFPAARARGDRKAWPVCSRASCRTQAAGWRAGVQIEGREAICLADAERDAVHRADQPLQRRLHPRDHERGLTEPERLLKIRQCKLEPSDLCPPLRLAKPRAKSPIRSRNVASLQ